MGSLSLGEHLVSCGREKAESEKRQSFKPEEGQHRTGFQARPEAVWGQKVGDRAWGGVGVFVDQGDTPWKRWAFPGRQEMVRGGQRATGGRREDIHGEAGQGVV